MKSSRLIAERTAVIMLLQLLLVAVVVVIVSRLATNLANAHKIALPQFAVLKVQTFLSPTIQFQ